MMISIVEFLTTIAIVTIVTIFLYFKWIYSYWTRKNVLQMKPNFPLGNLGNPLTMKKGIIDIFSDAYDEFKSKKAKFGGLYLVHKPVLLPVDIDVIKNILTRDFQHFVNHGNFIDEENDPLSANLLNLEDDKWKNLRSKLSPTFTSGKMKIMFQTMFDCGNQLKEHIELQVVQNKPLDIKEIVSCYTTDVIGSCAFGVDCNSLKNPKAQFRDYGRKLTTVSPLAALRLFIAFIMPELNKILKMKAVRSDVEKFFVDALMDVINHRTTTDFKRNDFVQLLLEVSQAHGGTSKMSLTTNEMIAQAFIFFLGGFETSANTLTFCLYELAFHQNVQQKLREEVIETLTRHDGQITYECLMEMSYMNQVVEETLRKYPPIPFLNRICTKTYKIPNTNVTIDKGTSVFINVLSIQMDPDHYPNPENFDPERFSKENKTNRNPYTFLAFGDGPRNCIGSRFASMQIRIALTSILSKYRVTTHETTPQILEYDPRALLRVSISPIVLNAEYV